MARRLRGSGGSGLRPRKDVMNPGCRVRVEAFPGGSMSSEEPFVAGGVFAVEDADPPSVPGVFGSPGRYVQGEGVLDHLGRYLSIIPSKRI